MQPYVFPYIGYFQLMQSVDLFVFYNDVNFIKKSWINRNRILLGGADHMFTIPCAAVSQNSLICDTRIAEDDKPILKILQTMRQSYKSAPFFSEAFPLVERVLTGSYQYIDQMAIASCREVAVYLGMSTRFEESKGRYGNETLKREHRLIDICHKENLTNYVNAIGGKEIYTKDFFAEKGVFLQFLKPRTISYQQLTTNFVPWLSIIDVLMFNSREQVMKLLDEYDLE